MEHKGDKIESCRVLNLTGSSLHPRPLHPSPHLFDAVGHSQESHADDAVPQVERGAEHPFHGACLALRALKARGEEEACAP